MWKTRFKSLARMATVCYMHSAISTNRRLYATATAPTARPANHMPNHTASTYFFSFLNTTDPIIGACHNSTDTTNNIQNMRQIWQECDA